MRIGFGFDLHRMEPGIPLRLGGIALQHPKGPRGHSDGDVVLHALTDALLGAAGQGDIGDHFPDTDPVHAGRDSAEFVRRAMELVTDAGWKVGNVDVTILAEAPHLGPAKARMAQRMAALLRLPPGQIGVKAKTLEGLGPIGAGDAIAATVAVILLPAANPSA